MTREEIEQLASPQKVMLPSEELVAKGRVRTWPASESSTLVNGPGLFETDKSHPLAKGLWLEGEQRVNQ